LKRFILLVIGVLFAFTGCAQYDENWPNDAIQPGREPQEEIIFVGPSHPLPQGYQPVELINLYEQWGRHFQLAGSDIEVCRVAFNTMERMFSAATEDGVEGFIITSGYRSSGEQAELFAKGKNKNAARPGTSEHETGLAFDVTAYGDKDFDRTPQFAWLVQHCSEYGFILRYPRGKEDITGYPYEPWHYRYVGTPHAKVIMDAGITLEEYLFGDGFPNSR
jgi:D-alanyl-D-alanine carboxypeptidase